MEAPEETLFKLMPTPNPAEYGFIMRVADILMTVGKEPVPGVTRYKDLKAGARERVSTYGDYVFLFAEAGAGNLLTLHFGKARDQAVADTPFRSFPTTELHTWDAILKDLYFVEDGAMPLSANTGNGTVVTVPRVYPRIKYIPAQTLATEAEVELFLNTAPWPRHYFSKDQRPIPTAVDWDMRGSSGSFPSCLHPHIEFPEIDAGNIVEGVGVIHAPGERDPARQVFPVTNVTTWRKFVLSHTQRYERGYWVREKVTLKPPRQGLAIVS